MFYLCGVPLVGIGVVLQVRDARQKQRPGYPLKAGIIYTVLGLLMIPGMLYQESGSQQLHVQVLPLVMIICGVWICAWWPWSRSKVSADQQG